MVTFLGSCSSTSVSPFFGAATQQRTVSEWTPFVRIVNQNLQFVAKVLLQVFGSLGAQRVSKIELELHFYVLRFTGWWPAQVLFMLSVYCCAVFSKEVARDAPVPGWWPEKVLLMTLFVSST